VLSIPFETIQFILAPILTAQLILVVLCYFSIFSRHVLKGFTLHVVFLLSFFIFLLGKTVQFYTDPQTEVYILSFRLIIFLGIGLPSLVLLLFQQCGIKLSLTIKSSLFTFSIFLACLATILQDIAKFNGLVSQELAQALPFNVTGDMAVVVLTAHFTFMLLIPCCFLLWREYRSKPDPMSVAFLLGSIAIAVSHLLSHAIFQTYWLIYMASIFSTLCWAWAVFYDVKRTRGRAYAVKDELLSLLHSGRFDSDGIELNGLLKKLAISADGDTQLYKLQVREVLTRLAELSIDDGADSDNMLTVAKRSYLAIDKITDVNEIVTITEQETRALGHIIADLPKHHLSVVAKAKYFIEDNLSHELDLKSVAQYCGVSQSYLMRYFKQETTQTINQFITKIRIEAAKNLLESKSVTDVAFDVGFNNSNYFSTVFKKTTGQTPSQFKQKLDDINHKQPS
jgi:AraC-like DNA-binding protein